MGVYTELNELNELNSIFYKNYKQFYENIGQTGQYTVTFTKQTNILNHNTIYRY